MSAGPEMTLPAPGSQVKTACGGRVEFEETTPRAPYRGEWLYFCLPACRELFESDSQFSCLAVQENKQNCD
jgi:hypothetical protein